MPVTLTLYCGDMNNTTEATAITEEVVQVIMDAEKYVTGNQIFPAITRHGADLVAEAVEYCEATLCDRTGFSRHLALDVLDALHEAARSL